MSDHERAPRRWLALLLLFVLPAGLRLAAIDHGLPQNHVPDTHVVRGALGMAKDKTLAPPIGRYSTYPNLLPYTLLPVYAAEYVGGRALGRWGGSGEFANAVLDRPELVHLPARVVLALLASLASYFVYRAARVAGLGPGAWVAGGLVATSLLHVQFSVQERPWAPLVTFTALSLWPAVRYVRAGRLGDLILCGIALGLGAATHQAGLPLLLVAGLAWAAGPLGWKRRDALVGRLLHGSLAVGAFAVLALAVGSPQRFIHGAPEQGAVAGFEEGADDLEADVQFGGQALVVELRWESAETLSRAFLGYDPLLLGLGLVGLLVAVRRRVLWPAAGAALAWGAFFGTNQNDHVRYLLPLVVLLALPAGAAVQVASRRFGRPVSVLLVLALSFPAANAVRLVWALRQDDTRTLAAEQLTALPEGSVVAVDRYGPDLPLSLPALERLASLRELSRRETFRLEVLRARAEGHDVPLAGGDGFDLIAVGDLFRFDERHLGSELAPGIEAVGTTPDAVLDALGVTHVLLVDRDPTDAYPSLLVFDGPSLPFERGRRAGEPAPLMPPLDGLSEPLWILDPSADADPVEARLPTELTFALGSLWRLERPGPRLELRAR
ncbi:MAG: ArnT family glycosyltransferase [Planctomycetota bacterium]